jgi:hypothetical protein
MCEEEKLLLLAYESFWAARKVRAEKTNEQASARLSTKLLWPHNVRLFRSLYLVMSALRRLMSLRGMVVRQL